MCKNKMRPHLFLVYIVLKNIVYINIATNPKDTALPKANKMGEITQI